MDNDESLAVKDAVYKLQLSLLDGIDSEDQLFAAGSVMCRSDYEDVVTERTIAKLCGYPLCHNPLPTDRPQKQRYRISLKEHKVYDQKETFKFCCTTCVVNSRAFSASLQDERSSTLNPAKLSGVLRMFENLSLDSVDKQEEKSVENKVGMKLKIHEKSGTQAEAVPLKEWLGPSNAIEGYVPRRDRNKSENHREGSNAARDKSSNGTIFGFSDMDFTSDIIMADGYGISKPPPATDSDSKSIEDQFSILELSSAPTKKKSGKKSTKSKAKKSSKKGEHGCKGSTSSSRQGGSDKIASAAGKEISSEKADTSTGSTVKSSLKSKSAKKLTCSVTWADEKTDNSGSGKLCEFKSIPDREGGTEMLISSEGGDDNSLRIASAEACARALSQVAEAVASGSSDIADAVTEAGIIVVPHQDNVNRGYTMENADVPETGPPHVKWSKTPEDSVSDFMDSEESFLDDPPEGFSLSLSPFATMYGALFEWVSSCSLAYIYGRDESCYEDYLTVNGREYPRKVIIDGGRSSEIKQTIAGCLGRALPGLVADLRLPIPVSSLEQGMGRLVETMTFAYALPAFRMKQWRLIVLLFLEALSVCRIPALISHLSNRRILLEKVLDGAEISAEQYEVMRDILIPLGRAPQFSSQCGA